MQKYIITDQDEVKIGRGFHTTLAKDCKGKVIRAGYCYINLNTKKYTVLGKSIGYNIESQPEDAEILDRYENLEERPPYLFDEKLKASADKVKEVIKKEEALEIQEKILGQIRETEKYILEQFFLEKIQPLDPEKYNSIEVWLNYDPISEAIHTSARAGDIKRAYDYGVLYPIENEAEGVQYDVVFSKVEYAIIGVQGGLHDITRKDTLVSVMRKGAWIFTDLANKHPNYVAEKLFIDKGSAELIIELAKRL